MNCPETQTLIHGYVDGELDLLKSLEVEQHLGECPECSRDLAGLRAIRSAIRGSDLYSRTPPGLERRVRSAVRRASLGDHPWRSRTGPLLALAASLALITTAAWGLAHRPLAHQADPVVTRELVAGHVRSRMYPSHQFDVESSDAHTVKPWFEGKLDFSPPVKDLADQGYPLIGGRLDYLQDRAVAALVYKRRKHTINLFIWPTAPGDESTPPKTTRQGFHLIRWTNSGMTSWAISDLNEGELQEFARMLEN